MLPVLVICVLLVPFTSAGSYGPTGNFNDQFGNMPMFPLVPAQPPMTPLPLIYPETRALFPMVNFAGQMNRYQNYAPFIPAPSMWQHMRMSPMSPFFNPLDCDTPLQYNNLHMMASPFVNPGQQQQWIQTPFQGQGQWGQESFQNVGKPQWNQNTFQTQGQGQWKQPGSWNNGQSVQMIGHWDDFPIKDRILPNPQTSGLVQKVDNMGTKFMPNSMGGSSFGSQKAADPKGMGIPVQSRRL